MTLVRYILCSLFAVALGSVQTPALAQISAQASALNDAPVGVMLFGDSIAAGYGLAPEDALAGQLEERLNELTSAGGRAVQVQSGGVSGDTSAGGLARLDWSLRETTDIVVIVLGGNDAMRGIPPGETERNLDALVSGLTKRGLGIVLTGMLAPPNLGPDYAAAFEPLYGRIAAKYGAALYPFILEGVAADPALNQADGIHPNAKGVAKIVEGLAPLVAQMIKLRQHVPS
jgi:acyl-CoA thioesterase-1